MTDIITLKALCEELKIDPREARDKLDEQIERVYQHAEANGQLGAIFWYRSDSVQSTSYCTCQPRWHRQRANFGNRTTSNR